MQDLRWLTGIEKEYFDWLCHLVCNFDQYEKVSYRNLLMFLYSKEFIPIMKRDINRYEDGINFRYKFGYENDYSEEFIQKYLGLGNCNILEMMIALAFRGEDQIMDNQSIGNRISQWFWSMIISLGLNNMTDDNFNLAKCDRIANTFINREYLPNGEGGLFTLSNTREDLTKVEIWYQFMWYLDEIIEEGEK